MAQAAWKLERIGEMHAELAQVFARPRALESRYTDQKVVSGLREGGERTGVFRMDDSSRTTRTQIMRERSGHALYGFT